MHAPIVHCKKHILCFSIFRRDKKALQHYDFLWEVMDENLKKRNKRKHPSDFLTLPPLLKMCFDMMRKYNVPSIVLAPFRKTKKDSQTNTDVDIDDDTLNMLSFDNPVDIDGLLGLMNALRPASPCPDSPQPTPINADIVAAVSVPGNNLLPTPDNAVIVYQLVGLSAIFKRLEHKVLTS